jgi:hypothetical protein
VDVVQGTGIAAAFAGRGVLLDQILDQDAWGPGARVLGRVRVLAVTADIWTTLPSAVNVGLRV